MKQILFSGYYGQSNMGDDAFGIIATWGTKRYWSKYNSSLLSSTGPTNKDISINYSLPKKQRFRGEFLFHTFKNIFKSDMLVLAGGSILHSQYKIGTINGLIFFLANIGLCKMGAIGVSIGPFKTDEDYKYIKKQLSNFKFLILRDKKSYDIALLMDLPYDPILASDLAFILPEIYLENKHKNKKNKKLLGISLCHYERYICGNIENESRREALIFETLKLVSKTSDLKLRFFILNGNDNVGDKEITITMVKKLNLLKNNYEVVDYSADTLLMLDKIIECDLMFTTRLHGAIFSAAMNVPSLLVEYHEKCTDYLDDIGLKDYWRIGDMKINSQLVKQKIQLLLKDKPEDFYPKRDILLSLSKNNFMKVKI